MRRIGLPLLLLALVGGTSAAFAITESLKNERSPVGVPRFTRVIAPTCDCRNDVARLRLRLRRADRVSAEIVDEDGETVRVLAEGRRVPRGPVTFRWDGRDASGSVVADGPYRLRIRLEDEDRTILLPTTIRVDSTAPRVRILDVRPIPEDRATRRVEVVYRTNDRAAAVLAVESPELPEPVVVRGRSRPAGRAKIAWFGKVDGERVPPGEYTLVLRVRDPAGNLSAPAEASVRFLPGPSG